MRASSLVALVAFAQWLLSAPQLGDFAVLIALYWVALESELAEVALAAAIVEAGAIMAAFRWSPSEPLKIWVGLTGLATAAGVLGITIRQRRALLISLHERAARLEVERDQEGRLAAAAERARIAREMHDIVAHNLSVIIALADGASYTMESSPRRAAQATERVSATGRQALLEMRRLLGVLREDSGRAAARAAARPRSPRRPAGAGARRRHSGDDGSRRRPARVAGGRPADRLPRRAGGADEHAQARCAPDQRPSRAAL